MTKVRIAYLSNSELDDYSLLKWIYPLFLIFWGYFYLFISAQSTT